MEPIKEKMPFNPMFHRDETYSLNGTWEFEIDRSFAIPNVFTKKIKVPFSVETPESGINRKVTKDDYLHYHLTLKYPKSTSSKKVRIHFDAVDQEAIVFYNQKEVLLHQGGYFPFFIDVDDPKSGDVLDLTIRDDSDSNIFAKGKQTNHPGGIFYTPTSGIWGNAYFEILSKTSLIDDFLIIPNYGKKEVSIKVVSDIEPKISLYFSNELIETKKGNEVVFDLKDNFHPWSDASPNLYDLKIETDEDAVFSYFGVKKFEVKENDGFKLFYLNDKPIYLNGLLDQGYFSHRSGMTPLCYESLEKEIKFVKESGFNFLRKHIKVEGPRWYYLCDKYGIIVMQDFVSTFDKYDVFRLGALPTIGLTKGKKNKTHFRKEKLSKEIFEKEMPLYVDHFKNSVSTCLWCLFNEGWGQFDATRLTKKLKELDYTHKIIDSTSGWFDEGAGDIDSKHIYFRKPRMKNKKDRVLFLSEFGGYSYSFSDHTYAKKTFGYKRIESQEDLLSYYKKTYLKWLIPLITKEGLCGSVYTQLSDVEGEINGLLTYDRERTKIESDELKKINDAIYSCFDNRFKD